MPEISRFDGNHGLHPRLVLEWLALRRGELEADWSLAERRRPLSKIEPLDEPMTPRLVEARYVDGYRIRLVYEDGAQGVVNLQDELWGEVFEPLRDVDLFKQFRLDPELQTIVWPTGADLAPEFLYERATA